MKFYYTNARFNGKTCLLAGPFLTPQEAEFCIDPCGQMAVDADATFTHATFGVLECNKHIGLGIYNRVLNANGIECEVPN